MGAMQRLRAFVSSIPDRFHGSSRSLRATAALVLVAAVWFAVNVIQPVGPAFLLWLPTPFSVLIATSVIWRASKNTSLPMPTRRFWRHLCITMCLIGMGSIAQAADVLSDPGNPGPHTGPVMLGFDGCATLVIVYALFRLPLGKQTAGERIRVGLDAGTVMLATAVFLWHIQTGDAMSFGGRTLVASVLITVLALVAVFAVAKVVLSSHTFIQNAALRMLAYGMLVGVVGPLTQPLLVSKPHLFPTQVSIPLVFMFGGWAGERQRAATAVRRRGAPEARRRSFSTLPYAAVAAVDALLISVTWYGDDRDRGLIVGATVLLTGLVVLRQVMAFRDNGRLLAQLDHGATHDALTQLPNRVLFGQRLHKALTAPGDRPVCVALIDLDDFKEVNDTLGHEVGDLLLIAVAQRLAGCIRVEDTVARLGGDEFVVVLDGADAAAADLAAGRMITALSRPVMADGHELPIRASIGIADGHTGDEASVLLRRADIAMYAAKKLGGTAFLHYEDSMAANVTDHANLGIELREAITAGQLFLLYQPIVALHDGRVTGAEALVRWAHPVRGTLAPDTFIPLAERTGLIVPLGRWVIREACRQFAAWMAEHGDAAPAVLNINVSARDLREPDFAAAVASIMAEYGVPAQRIALEITETMAVELGPSVVNLHRLRALGVRISLDDFGTGCSTLTLLHDCPVDEIKLDRSFVQAEAGDRPPMAAAVIHLAQALGLHAVAEGVETPDQAAHLRSLGYVAAQGYHFARPMPARQLGALLRPPVSRDLDPEPLTWEMSA